MTDVLVLGGTQEGRELVERLCAQGVAATSSLAGRTTSPRALPGTVRRGGFGGVEGLVSWIHQHRPDMVIDATHPFAETMTRHAAQACADTGTPLLRLCRPGWQHHRLAGSWDWVSGHREAAAQVLAQGASRPLLTVGRQAVLAGDYQLLTQVSALVRVADATGMDGLPLWQIIESRGPFTLTGERDLLQDNEIDIIVTKDSGGSATEAKLTVADELGIGVVMIARPPVPPEVETTTGVDEAITWVLGRVTSTPQ